MSKSEFWAALEAEFDATFGGECDAAGIVVGVTFGGDRPSGEVVGGALGAGVTTGVVNSGDSSPSDS